MLGHGEACGEACGGACRYDEEQCRSELGLDGDLKDHLLDLLGPLADDLVLLLKLLSYYCLGQLADDLVLLLNLFVLLLTLLVLLLILFVLLLTLFSLLL
jgi:hypothetical protein